MRGPLRRHQTVVGAVRGWDRAVHDHLPQSLKIVVLVPNVARADGTDASHQPSSPSDDVRRAGKQRFGDVVSHPGAMSFRGRCGFRSEQVWVALPASV